MDIRHLMEYRMHTIIHVNLKTAIEYDKYIAILYNISG